MAGQAHAQVNSNCVQVAANHVSCELIPDTASGGQPIGIGVAPGTYATFTNGTGTYLQVNEVSAITREQLYWSEFCVYLNDFATGQSTPGAGEVGCSAKNIGEDYPPIGWGNGTGLSVAPGGIVYLNSHTEPAGTNHTYSLSVKLQTTGLYAWRQPKIDAVITCNGMSQSTTWAPWVNNTGQDLHLTGASIYSVSSSTVAPNTLNGPACVYVFKSDGSPKYANCDDALRTRGQVAWAMMIVSPGEFVAAQGVNACAAQHLWDWSAFLNIW